MSEVARALLDANCIDSRPAFYSAQLTYALPATALAIGRRQATIPCKSDTWFLCQGATQDNGIWLTAGTPYRWEAKAFPTTFQIVRANTGETYSNTPQQMVLQNYNLNNFSGFDDYIVFRPAELIQIVEDVRTGAAAALTNYAFVTLMGVEFQMPSWWS
jgi:hypothetical protein